ncbi:MAG: V-type ATPase subunit [Treponema sp.]|jgi:vacuolar-type H+-ATPase subunit C/Vma6|nr:V-type ATPase subunit [Treponema sp.]
MLRAGERAYSYAKTCGIIGKSFVGKRITPLRGIRRLSDLDRLLFPETKQDLPEQELLVDLEARILQRSVGQIKTILGAFVKPPNLLVWLIRSYEYGDMKGVFNALVTGEAKSPGFTDIGRFRRVAFEAYPDVGAMVKGTEFEAFLKDLHLLPFTLGKSQSLSAVALQTKIDTLYYTALWKDLRALPKGERRASEHILSEEIALKNAVWALRLRTYYGMSPEEIREKLIAPESKAFLAPAEALLSLPLDVRADWLSWKYASLLNPEKPHEQWRADPRYLQNAASEYLYRLVHSSFRRRPFSLDSFFCFIKLKQFEENLLTSIAEGLGMGMAIQDVFTLLEIPS